MNPPARRAALLWTGGFVALGAALAFLYPDSHQRDGGYHFLFARWAWVHPDLFVDVWNRPAFTLLYSFPAQIGYPAAKLFTVLLSASCAWHTARLAGDLGLSRPALAIPLLVFQPCFLIVSSETMTEPLFALLLVIALRLHFRGRPVAAMIVASTLILARPEGFIVIAIWAAWILVDPRDLRPRTHRVLPLLWLTLGLVSWWIAALAVTGDPLHIQESWPKDWASIGSPYGSGRWWSYLARLPEIAGPLFAVPFIAGVIVSIRRRQVLPLCALTLTVFFVHAGLWSIGGFGSAGYARYMVTVSPAIALLALIGWNWITSSQAWTTGVIAASGVIAVLYVDGWPPSRDAWAIDDAHAAVPDEKNGLVWSHPYMAIRADVDPWASPKWGTREDNLRFIQALPRGTVAFWDADIGPVWLHLTVEDFERAGFVRRASRAYSLTRRLRKSGWIGIDGPRRQEMHVLYRP